MVSTPLIPALGRQRHVDLCEFEASLVYKASSRKARTVTQRNLALKIKTRRGRRRKRRRRRRQHAHGLCRAKPQVPVLRGEVDTSPHH